MVSVCMFLAWSCCAVRLNITHVVFLSLSLSHARALSLSHRPTARQLSVSDEHGHSYLHPGTYTVHLGAPPRSHTATLSGGALTVPLVLEGDADAPLLLRAPTL